ncbi:type VI secretion system-associated protein [Pseudorhodoferax aquiterrae]|uniref:Type VI secretion system-associated protein n=1 Tax=Pseudorhodoferax aquiterrae TaxID=747304 RepID=A0ABQ3G1P4_9BURK|nr:type VI secretion system baseplate subunit TssK [Pseudorhodoferax aquiterrae]GHC81267.1 type VI secretion system-associated protein [Pseudorhodoferax aquiterrae]
MSAQPDGDAGPGTAPGPGAPLPAADKVVWTQGMFLLPHHFQQETRYLETLVDRRVRPLGAHGWGFSELVLDESLLPQGQLGLVRAQGVLPDGTPFCIPQTDAAPLPLALPADVQNELVYLAVPQARDGVDEVDFDAVDPGTAGRPQHRYRITDHALRDRTSAGDDPEPVQTAALCLRLVRARELGDGQAALGVARVAERRSDRQLVLDRAYTPPQTRIDASGQLSAMAALLHGLVRQRAEALAARMGQLGHGVSELSDFLMLLTLNRAEPLLRQHARAPHAHPEQLHRDCLQLAGELATFAAANPSSRQPREYPLYQHEDLQASFAPLLDALRAMLSTALQRHAEQIALTDRTHGVRTAVLADAEMLRSASLVLAVNAQLPAEQLRQRFPAQSKLGPVDRIRDLVNLQLPGVALRPLPVAPRQLPFHAGHHYFELDRGGELWKQLERSGSLALHVAGDFPGLELELWAIRT